MASAEEKSGHENGQAIEQDKVNANEFYDQRIRLRSTAFFVFIIFSMQAVCFIVFTALGFKMALSLDDRRYAYFRDINIMIFIGFGFLMTFLRRYGLSAIGYTMIISAITIQFSIVWEYCIFNLDPQLPHYITIENLDNALFCAGAVMISFGAVLGKVTPGQLTVMALIESLIFWINCRICYKLVEAHDVGGGMVIHLFGAYFGLGVAVSFSGKYTKNHPDNAASYVSDITSLIGTLFLWLCWPSFNAAVAESVQMQSQAMGNTFLALCACIVSFAIVSLIVNEPRSPSAFKFNAIHLQNSTLAGGVAMGVVADQDFGLWGPVLCGCVAGGLSAVGYANVSPILETYLGIQDVCGINNLHGMPGWLSGVIGIAVASFAPGLDPRKQVAALFISFGIASISGLVTGWIMLGAGRLQGTSMSRRRDLFNDSIFWGTPSDYGQVVDEDPGMAGTGTASYIFVYGTAKPRYYNHAGFASICDQGNGSIIGPATSVCNLLLFTDMYGCPYITMPVAGQESLAGCKVKGELFKFDRGVPAQVLEELDDYEESPVRYQRRIIPVTSGAEDEKVVEAYIYCIDNSWIQELYVPGLLTFLDSYPLELHLREYRSKAHRESQYLTPWGGFMRPYDESDYIAVSRDQRSDVRQIADEEVTTSRSRETSARTFDKSRTRR